MNKRIKRSLKLQLFFAALIAVALAAVTFGLSFFLGNAILDRTVYTDSYSEMIEKRQFSKLQKYVDAESIELESISRLDEWCMRNKRILIFSYNGTELVYQYPPSSEQGEPETPFRPELSKDNHEGAYALWLNDGTMLYTFISCYVGNSYYLWMTVIAGILAFVTFSTCFIMFVNKKVSYISLLQRELEILSGGQLEYQVTVKGDDELGVLAGGIDEMRKSIIDHQQIENQIRSANSELITSMSHDLRTPLTSLLAYLELLERKKYADEEQMNSLIHKSVGQTMRIKDMADRLFRYFLVYATEWENSELEKTDADQLFMQVLDEYRYSLESKGFHVDTSLEETSGSIAVNTDLLHRALDNLYSNLLKYADREKPLKITYESKNTYLFITMTNAISNDREKKDSSSIGLKTCRRIIEYHKGTFLTEENEGAFTVKITLPLIANTDN